MPKRDFGGDIRDFFGIMMFFFLGDEERFFQLRRTAKTKTIFAVKSEKRDKQPKIFAEEQRDQVHSM